MRAFPSIYFNLKNLFCQEKQTLNQKNEKRWLKRLKLIRINPLLMKKKIRKRLRKKCICTINEYISWMFICLFWSCLTPYKSIKN